MFKEGKLDKPTEIEKPIDPVAGLDLAGLLDLRARVDAALPPTKLANLDLEAEIMLQYQQGKALLAKVVISNDVPTNQKAQVANSCTAMLDQLLKMQTKLYTAERIKAIEQCLIKAVRLLPREVQEKFFEDYEKIYAEERA